MDYLETRRGDFFVVIGEQHPRNKTLAYLKYVPNGPVVNPSKEWHRAGIRFKRVLPYYHYSYLKNNLEIFSDFLFDCPVNDITITAIPKNVIKAHYKPELRIKELFQQDNEKMKKNNLDELEKKVVNLVSTLAELAGIQISTFGVTGSILPGIHNPAFSDIDLTIYGENNAHAVKKVFHENQNNPLPDFCPLSDDLLEKNSHKQANLFKINQQMAFSFLKRRWNSQEFRGTRFSLHPVLPHSNNYGNVLYKNAGYVQLEGIIHDTREGMFYPPSWQLEITSSSVSNLVKGEKIVLICFEGLYHDVFNEGEKIRVQGKLENELTPSGEFIGYRVVVGGSSDSKILLVDPLPGTD
jgi:predicted nucleotidyltransferase